MLDEKFLAVLNKSGFFSTTHHNFLVPTAEIRGMDMQKFNFFISIRNCDDEIGYFVRDLKSLLASYMKSWAAIAEKSEKGLDWKDFSSKTFDIFGSIDWQKLFDRIKAGTVTGDIDIPACNTKMRIKRFGDLLAFDVFSLKSPDKRHINGVRALEALCRKECPDNNHGIYELIKEVRINIPLDGESKMHKELVCDFGLLCTFLSQALSWTEWNFDISALVSAYAEEPYKPLVIGEYQGFNLSAKLVHKQAGRKDTQRQTTPIWRKGNVQNVKNQQYRFTEGDDLLLQITIRSSLPELTDQTDRSFKYCAEQFRLADVVAIISVQLGALQLHKYIEHRNQLNARK